MFVYTATSDAPSRGGSGGSDDHDSGHGDGHEDHEDNHLIAAYSEKGEVDSDEDPHDGGHAGRMETITDFDTANDRIDFSAFGLELQMSEGPQAHAIWAEQHMDGAMLYLDTNGQISGGNPAELSILLLGVNATSLDIEQFIV